MRLIYFTLILIASVTLPWWLVLPLWILYAFSFKAYELIVLGILLDAYFGYVVPWHIFYTFAAVVICLGIELLKPRLAFYDTRS